MGALTPRFSCIFPISSQAPGLWPCSCNSHLHVATSKPKWPGHRRSRHIIGRPCLNTFAFSTPNKMPQSNGGVAALKPVGSQDGLVCPALHLYPLNDTFVPKQINLAPPSSRNRIKIGRYSNNKSVPSPVNGFFDSKVLSRAHAEVWCENDRVYIKDVKSSNGTFINGTRLSPESQESEPAELHSDDVVDFGIDILTDDNKEILHRRVACRVFLVISPEDALKLRNDFTSLYRGGVHGGTLSNAGLCPGAEGGFRRGKTGVNLDHVLYRLQNELQKSKLVGTELKALGTTIQNINETLGGGAVQPQDAPFPQLVPAKGTTEEKERANASSMDASAFASFESQLASTHDMLAAHVDKIKSLESTLAAYEHIKEEVASLKLELEQTKRTVGTSDPQHDTKAWAALGLSDQVRVMPDGFDDEASVTSTDTEVPVLETPVPDPSHAAHVPLPRAETLEPTVDHENLLMRIEALEQSHHAQSQASMSQASSSDTADLLARLERLEKAVQTQPPVDAPLSPEMINPSLAEWRATFEQRWKEQSQGWEAAQQKINDAIVYWSNPATPRMVSYACPTVDAKGSAREKPKRHWIYKIVDPAYQALGVTLIMVGMAVPTVLAYSALKHLLHALGH